MPESTFHCWVQRALMMVAIALTLRPLVFAGARMYGRWHGWNDLFELFLTCWVVEMLAALTGAVLIERLTDAREQGARTSRAQL